MGRKRVPKGQVFLKKKEKILSVLETLPADHQDDEFLSKFKEMYPKDWDKVIARYEAHERLTPAGKGHPMPEPNKYLLNAARTQRLSYRRDGNLNVIKEQLAK